MTHQVIGRIAFGIISMAPLAASADPYAVGPFYVRYDEAATAEDRQSVVDFIVQTYVQPDQIIVLCATTRSPSLARIRQQALRAELVKRGIPYRRIKAVGDCGERLRHPQMSEGGKDAVVVTLGPIGS